MSPVRKIPTNVAPPMSAAKYSHSVEVPPNARWLYVSGQLGARPDGSVTRRPSTSRLNGAGRTSWQCLKPRAWLGLRAPSLNASF